MKGKSVTFEKAYSSMGLAQLNGHELEFISARDLIALELTPARWIVPGILPEGVSLLAGKPKLGKSWLVFGLTIAVASGGVALDTKLVEQGDTLYLALEDNLRRLRKRLAKMLQGDDAPEGLHIAIKWPRLDEGGTEKLEWWLKAHPSARLVVIDTLAKIRPQQRGHNVYAEDYAALEKLLPLASEYGVAILVVHHLRKGAADDPMDEISGSTGLSGGVDGVLVLRRDRGQGDAYLYVDGRDIEEPTELALTWNAKTASWTLAGNADEFKLSTERQDVLRVLRNAEEPLQPKNVAAALDKSNGAVRELLSQMSHQGLVRTAGYGKYTVPDTPDSTDTLSRMDTPESTSVSGVSTVSPNDNEEFGYV